MSRVLRRLAKKSAVVALNHFGPKILARAEQRAGKALGLVPTEHREQVQAASVAVDRAADAARQALSHGDCAQAYEAASAARAFALTATIEAKDAGGGARTINQAKRAMRTAQSAHRAVLDACEIVPKRGLPARKAPRELEVERPALPAAPVSGLRRRRRR